MDQVKTYELTEADWKRINEISDKYYRNWDWNFGKSPEFDKVRRERFPIGSVEVRLNVAEGKIQEVKIFGDFFGLGEISDVEKMLEGTRYTKEDLQQVVSQIDIKKYFGNITEKDLLGLLY